MYDVFAGVYDAALSNDFQPVILARLEDALERHGLPSGRRLLDLGLVPGTLVEAELTGAGGDPVAYRIRGALIALRKDQSRWIQVDRRVGAPT